MWCSGLGHHHVSPTRLYPHITRHDVTTQKIATRCHKPKNHNTEQYFFVQMSSRLVALLSTQNPVFDSGTVLNTID
jgi:hypothetical protein